ncbi:MAG: HU family DNA-binding protein [Prevotella sp.]|nr:HU family DNA-binding protein [Prevotella sp.]
MGKLTIQEIAKILVEKNKLSAKEASRFAAAMFEIIQQQLDSEDLVKIKGLGTFKVIRVEARESVNVRTGERMTIESHAKITFTPDATMKELVNKPFSQFETVVLNDGVEFEDTPVEETPVSTEEPAQFTEEPAQFTEEPAQFTEEAAQFAEKAAQFAEEPPHAQPLMEVVENSEEKEEEIVMQEDDEENSSWKKPFCYGLLTLALMAGSAYGGYWYGKTTAVATTETPVEEVQDVVVEDSVEVIDTDSIEVIEEQVAEESPAQTQTEEPATEEEPFWKKYEAMDARVRTGAYHIVGTDHEVTVRKGETLSKIARRELGEGMSCYIEVYNDLKANAELKEGQTIKIPKLKWKKKR